MRAFRLLAFLGVLWGCTPKAPNRPTGVPASASWAGGWDGGAWVECRLEPGAAANQCRVYDEISGQVLLDAPFVLRSCGKPARIEELRYNAFDGTSIYLSTGDVLDPVVRGGD